MLKPNNYDNVSTSGDFTPIEPGGHHLIIKKVEESVSKAGKEMIIVAFDMAPGDSQPGYFSKQFAADIRPDKKWPRSGRQYIVATDKDGNAAKSFKSFITSVEKSNSGFVTQWGNNFGAQFKNKRVGGVFGKVDNEYNGKVTARTELRWFCADDKVEGARIPDHKRLPNTNTTVPAPASDPELDGFLSIPDGSEEEIPF